MAYLLHIDTSGETGLMAISHDGIIKGSITNADTRNHAATINLHIADVLQQAGITMQQIDAVAVCGGPGSYTGLRIGLATAKGLCYILNKPLMMHNKLRLISLTKFYENLDAYDIYMSLMPAREKEYYIASYSNKSETILEPQHLLQQELEANISTYTGRILLVCDISLDINNLFSLPEGILAINSGIDSNAWAKYSFERFMCNEFVNLEYSEPFYLKAVYTHKSKNIN